MYASAVAMGRACKIRRELADEFATSTRLYAEMVVILVRAQIVEFDQIRQSSQEAYQRMEVARAAFEEHVASHRC
jgi:hypothetical protein